MNKYQTVYLINVITISFLLINNLFFFIFVHNKYDYSPNFALFFITSVMVFGQIIIMKYNNLELKKAVKKWTEQNL